LYFLVINAVTDLATLRRVFWVLLAAAALVSTLCLYQDVTGSYTQEFGGLAHRNYEASEDTSRIEVVQRRRTWDRAQGPVDEPNRFAQVLIVLVPLAVFLFRNAPTPLQRLLAAGLGGLTVMGAGLTLSRGGILTLGLLAIGMARVRWVRTWQLAAGAAVMVVAFSAVSPFFVSRMLSIVNAGHLLGDDQFSHQQADGAMRGRLTEMLAALHVFMDHPVIGVGPSQFARYYFVEYAGNANIKFREINVPRRAHSLFFELGAEQGALGLAGFSALVGGLMWGLWRARRRWLERDLERADLAAALALSLFAYLATGFFLHLSYQRYFWLLVALGSAALHVVTTREGDEEPRSGADGRGGNRFAAVGETTR
jgi:O-antigen ligase